MTTRNICRSWSGAGWGLLFAAIAAGAPAAEWKPEGNVEIVVPSGPGSGLDATARSLQAMLQNANLVAASSSVVNRAGGGGSLAYVYINQKPGSGNFISITSPGLVTNKIVGASDIDYRDVTPLAQLFEENIAFMVRAESPLRTAQDVVERLRKDPTSLLIGTATALGGANHIAAASAFKAAGIDIRRLRTPVFKSGGEVTTALLGDHVSVVPIAVPVAVPQLANGKVRVIAVSSQRRLPGALADVPTWREAGIDSAYSSWRGVVGPRGMRPEQIAYWDRVFAQLTTLDAWKQELDKNLWNPSYLNSAQSRDFLEQQRREHQAILGDLGLVKQ